MENMLGKIEMDLDNRVAPRALGCIQSPPPTDWAEVIGVLWDGGRHRVWFTMGGLENGNALVSFDPDRIQPDCFFDFSESIDSLICPDGGPYDDCYHYYPIPSEAVQPAHMALDAAGNVWFTEYWGNAIGVLDPERTSIEECSRRRPRLQEEAASARGRVFR